MCKRLKIVPKPGHVLFIGTHNRICARRRALSGIGGRRWPTRNIPATTTRRSNGRSCSRARAASHPGRSGPSATSRDRPRGAGSKASATAASPGPRTTARPSRTSRSSRGDATGGWRWRWTFQNKRRRYSHEGRRDTGLRGEAREPGLVGPRHVRFGPSARIRARMPRSHMMPPMRLPDAVTPTAHQQYFVSSFRLEGLPIIWRKI